MTTWLSGETVGGTIAVEVEAAPLALVEAPFVTAIACDDTIARMFSSVGGEGTKGP